MTARRDNVLLVHWHDLGRYLGAYGHTDVSSPRLDQLAAEGILFTRAHATAPLCSPSRGSLFTGRYPQSNGLVGLAHHGWEYRAGVRTLPHILSESGWYTALFGMQHETSYPSKLGFDEFDVSNSYCEYVVEHATRWLTDPPEQPFLLTAGFFETHRPYPRDRYEPADADDVAGARLSARHRRHPAGPRRVLRVDLGRRRRGRPAARHAGPKRASTESTWVVFMTDHGPALPRAKSTLYDAGTGIAMIVRPPRNAAHRAPGLRRTVQRRRPGAHAARTARPRHSRRHRRHVARAQSANAAPRHQAGAHRGLHDEDVSRFLRSDPRHPHKGIQLHRELRVAAATRSAVGYRRKRARPHRGATACTRSGQRANSTTLSRIRRSRTTCWVPTSPTRPKRSPTTSRCCSTTGARRPTTSYRPSSRAPELRSATPKLTYAFTVHRSPAGRRSPRSEASKTTTVPGNSFTHGDRNVSQCQAN